MFNKIKIEWCIASVIFILTIIELISWRLSLGAPAIICDPGNGYLLQWYPLLNTIGFFTISILFVLKLFLFSHCIYTEMVTVLYFLIQGFNLSALIFKFGSDFYDSIIYPVFVFSIILLILIKIVRCLSKNPYQQ